MGITSVTKKGQVTIPADVRKTLGIKEKDRLEIAVEGNKAVIKKLRSVTDLRGSIKINANLKSKKWKEVERETAVARGKKGV